MNSLFKIPLVKAPAILNHTRRVNDALPLFFHRVLPKDNTVPLGIFQKRN